MLRRSFALAALALSLCAAMQPPAALSPYVKGNRFEPGDYGWIRGRFPGATPVQKAEWQSILAWMNQCREEQFATIRAELSQRGIKPGSAIEQSNGTGLCGSFAYAQPESDPAESWSAFETALARARPVAQSIVWSAALAQQVADPDHPTLTSLLIARPMTDQVLRSALSWGQGDVAGAPPLSPVALGIVRGQLWSAISERDHANTAWLKAVVAKDGWPTISQVGADASHMAWLLVQHADDDPVFQLDMLRLMEPLAAHDEVAKKDYAYLYDRVMLKLNGKQRYASQFNCRNGHYAPLPLEDASKVDTLRRGMGMETVASNVARMEKSYGPCPPDAVPPPTAKR